MPTARGVAISKMEFDMSWFDRLLEARRRVRNNVVLVSADGHFQCTGEHAVEVAYAMSNAEAVLDKSQRSRRFASRVDRYDVAHLVGDYLDGSLSITELQQMLNRHICEIDFCAEDDAE